MQRPIQRRLSVAVLLVLLGLLAGCGGNDASSRSSTETGTHNDADVQFATEMIPHHAQALSMVDMTVGKGLSPDVAALTEGIRMSQAPEIEQMAAWLEKWGQPVPATSRDHAGHDMSTMSMPGMASMEDMAALENAQGAQFEHMFLSMMIEHHQDAIDMGETELQNGQNAAAKALAQRIIDAQQTEIRIMNGLL